MQALGVLLEMSITGKVENLFLVSYLWDEAIFS
jgi:hypothetical protein